MPGLQPILCLNLTGRWRWSASITSHTCLVSWGRHYYTLHLISWHFVGGENGAAQPTIFKFDTETSSWELLLLLMSKRRTAHGISLIDAEEIFQWCWFDEDHGVNKWLFISISTLVWSSEELGTQKTSEIYHCCIPVLVIKDLKQDHIQILIMYNWLTSLNKIQGTPVREGSRFLVSTPMSWSRLDPSSVSTQARTWSGEVVVISNISRQTSAASGGKSDPIRQFIRGTYSAGSGTWSEVRGRRSDTNYHECLPDWEDRPELCSPGTL